jgi:spore coat protein CotH
LSVNSRDLAELRQNYQLNTYYTADLTWKNVKVRNVGIRSRGQGSRNPTKLGLRVDIAHYTTGQTLVGLSTIILDNMWQDGSFLRERLAFTMFEKLNEPVPRESFCRLYINNEYQGLYAIMEEIDGNFAKRVTGENDGTVFEYHWASDHQWRAEDLGAIENYKPRLEPRTHVLDADSTLYTPIQSLFREVNAAQDAVWRERVEQYLDLTQFMKHTAIEQFIVENDGILGYAGMNNFYMYRFQGTSKHRLFVWDKDQAFLAKDTGVSTTSDNILFNRAMTYPDLRDVYLSTLESCATIAKADDFLLLEVDRLTGIIYDAAIGDPKKNYTNAEYQDAVQFVRDVIAPRPDRVLREVAALRQASGIRR